MDLIPIGTIVRVNGGTFMNPQYYYGTIRKIEIDGDNQITYWISFHWDQNYKPYTKGSNFDIVTINENPVQENQD